MRSLEHHLHTPGRLPRLATLAVLASRGGCGAEDAGQDPAGVGSLPCSAPFLICDGVCVDPASSAAHCGACDQACDSGQICSAGECVDGDSGSGGGGGSGGATSGGATSGGTRTGGASSGGVMTGGVATGGISTGGVPTGGVATGGAATGGSATGGVATGGEVMGGTATGGAMTGGIATGGVATGGASSGGVATGGVSSGGTGGSGGAGWEVGGECYPLCADASLDPDGDGWGWEDESSCIVVGSAPYSQGTACGEAGTGGASGGSGGASGGSGGASGGSGGASGGSGGCDVSPVNPNATRQARNLLCYLYEIYGTRVLSGQQETSWSNPQNDISWYATNFGVYPAVLGGDYLYPDGTSSRAIAYWNDGGIPMIRYHMGAPPNSDTYENSKGTANIGAVLTAGSAENRSFLSKLDYVAAELQKLEDAEVAVLWAPFHEYQPNGWFWWSKGSADQFKQLWRTMYEYLTSTKGLDNLVWLAPSSGTVDAAWYPGKALLDLAGPDTYDTNPPFSGMYSAAKAVIGSTVPIPLHETGTVPQPSTMFPTAAPWVLWNIWAGYQSDGTHNSVATVRTAIESPYTINRDELPDLR